MSELILGVLFGIFLIGFVVNLYQLYGNKSSDDRGKWDASSNYKKVIIVLLTVLFSLFFVIPPLLLMASDISSLTYYWMIICTVMIIATYNNLVEDSYYYLRSFSSIVLILVTFYIYFNGLDFVYEEHMTLKSELKTVESYKSRFFNTDEVKLDSEEYYSIKDIKILQDLKQCIGKTTEFVEHDYFLYGLKNGMSNRVLVRVFCELKGNTDE